MAFFFSFTVNILYYYGVMQWLVEKIGWLLRVTVGTTPAESVNAAANIFLGFVSRFHSSLTGCTIQVTLAFFLR